MLADLRKELTGDQRELVNKGVAAGEHVVPMLIAVLAFNGWDGELRLIEPGDGIPPRLEGEARTEPGWSGVAVIRDGLTREIAEAGLRSRLAYVEAMQRVRAADQRAHDEWAVGQMGQPGNAYQRCLRLVRSIATPTG